MGVMNDDLKSESGIARRADHARTRCHAKEPTCDKFILLGRSDNDRRLAAVDEGMHLPLILGQLLARQRGR